MAQTVWQRLFIAVFLIFWLKLAMGDNSITVPVATVGTDKIATLPANLKSGDCTMKAGSKYVFHSDGSGEFHGITRTFKSVDYDVWHQSAYMRDDSGKREFAGKKYSLIAWGRKMDSMSMAPDAKWHMWEVSFWYPKALFARLDEIVWVGDC